jgi:hypothetical protein
VQGLALALGTRFSALALLGMTLVIQLWAPVPPTALRGVC